MLESEYNLSPRPSLVYDIELSFWEPTQVRSSLRQGLVPVSLRCKSSVTPSPMSSPFSQNTLTQRIPVPLSTF